jgi:hypothetical protein
MNEKSNSEFGWKEALVFGTLMLALTLVLSIGLTTIRAISESQACPLLQTMNTAPGYKYRYELWTGCRVHIPSGLWVPQADLDKYLATDPPLVRLPKEFIK